MKVLVADDSELIYDCLQEMLVHYAQVEDIGSLKKKAVLSESIRILKRDNTIIDVSMPGLSGREVLNAIRKEQETVAFIILTFYASDYVQQTTRPSVVTYFFSKVDGYKNYPC